MPSSLGLQNFRLHLRSSRTSRPGQRLECQDRIWEHHSALQNRGWRLLRSEPRVLFIVDKDQLKRLAMTLCPRLTAQWVR